MIKKRRLAKSREYPMTLPDERYRAVVQTRRFLLDLCNKDHTPKVPKIIREHARSMLRHYPSDFEMDRAAASAPEVFQKQMEPLTRMIMVYDRELKEEQNGNK